MILNKHHFGIKKRKYLFALMDFVQGYSSKESAERASLHSGEKVSPTMIKETFRRNLMDEINSFRGTEAHCSFQDFLERNKFNSAIGNTGIALSNSSQTWLTVILYLREVFDMRAPMQVASIEEYGVEDVPDA